VSWYFTLTFIVKNVLFTHKTNLLLTAVTSYAYDGPVLGARFYDAFNLHNISLV
jgi:hypothetical protein